jgi:DNA-binding transcriptional LysR family regulator
LEWLRTMRLFVGVVQNGSLSAAGRQLGLSPASVSRHISALEESLGGRLLNRTSRKLTLTEAGEIYFRKVESILHQIGEANDSVAQLQSVPRGTLRVHSRMLVGHQYIVPALPAFQAQYPEIKLDLLLSNHAIDLVQQNIDIDIRIGKLNDSSLIARKLASSERIVCAAPAYLDRHPPISEPAELSKHNCLTYRLNLGRTVWHFKEPDGSVSDVPVDGSFQTDNGQALHSAALAGVGIVLMPDWSVREELADGRLVQLFPKHRVSYVEFENGVYAVYQKSRHMSAKVRVFVEFLVALFKQRLG